MAKIFKYTLRHNLMSYPFLVAVAVVLIAGFYETIYYLGTESEPFEALHIFGEGTAAPYLAFGMAVLPPLLTGRELSSGTIRNKLVTGTTKKAFFVSHLLVNSVLTAILTLIYFLPSLILCAKYYSYFKPYMVIAAIGYVMLGYLAVTVLSTVISVMSRSMLISFVSVAVVMISVVVVDSYLAGQLSRPQYEYSDYTSAVIDDSGEIIRYSEPQTKSPNPFFVEFGTKRTLMWTARRIMPFQIIGSGTGILHSHVTSIDEFNYIKQMNEKKDDDYPSINENCKALPYLLLYTVGFIAVTTCIGLFLFDRRNIK